MNEPPGWASPGSSPSDPPGDQDGQASDDTPRTPPGKPSRPEDTPPSGGRQSPPPHWSPQQPPPAGGPGWGAPPRPGGPGGPGGWTAWQQAPPAAKPGVIPLRPLAVGEILDGAVSTARAHWRTALGIALGVAILIQLASTVATGVWLRGNSGLEALENDPDPSTDELMDALTGTLSGAGVALLASLIGTVVATAMLTIVVSRAVLGRPVSLGDTWREYRPQLGRVLGLTLLVLLIVAGALLLAMAPGLLLVAAGATVGGSLLALLGGLAGLGAAVWLWVRYCLAAPALMLEKRGVVKALKRSAKLVRHSWWRIFGIQLLAWLLVQVVGFIVQIPASVVASVVSGEGVEGVFSGTAFDVSWTYLIVIGVGAVLSSTVTLPLSAGITALLYMDQRIRREALDLELARAAGPEAGPVSLGKPPFTGGPTAGPPPGS